MHRQKAKELLDRYLAGNASSREQKLVDTWYDRLADQRSLDADQDFEHLNDELWAGSCRKAGLQATNSKKRRIWPTIAVAAALLALISVGMIMWTQQNQSHNHVLLSSDIPPGGNSATLTMANGRTIDLSKTQSGIVVGDEMTYLDGSPVLGEQGNRGASESVQGNERSHKFTRSQAYKLTTPRGGTYQLTLPDGSRVWLNAASTLTYPKKFANDERVVYLDGEAYFEVAKSGTRSWPFRVQSSGQAIEVLGTAFNVSTYSNEPVATTTVAQGKVRLTNHLSAQSAVLSPGEQGRIVDANTSIATIDVPAFVAWKDGDFVFGVRDFAATMREVARWYDIEVVYDTGSPPETIRIGGWVSRDKPLSSITNLLEMTGTIHTKLSGRRLMIMD